MQIKLKFKFKLIRPATLLVILFLAIILFEGYLVYNKIYANLSIEANAIPNESVVRVDLSAYNKTISLLDYLKAFVVKPWNVNNPSPF